MRPNLILQITPFNKIAVGSEFIENTATFTVSTQNEDEFSFSGTGDTTIPAALSNFAEIGHERNGVFFLQGNGTQTRRGDP
jgi:hypothetical protein